MDKFIDSLMSARTVVAKEVLALFEPEIAAVCHLLREGKQVSEERVESLFDSLLDHCYDERIDKLFKELCEAAEQQHSDSVKHYTRYYEDQWGK